MIPQNVKIDAIHKITPDVLQIVTDRPLGYKFIPGQATEVCINKINCDFEKSPFTFTSLPENNYLEFTIKTYPERGGLTTDLLELKKGDSLILHDVFGAITYSGEGVFIAGGAGVTPFISIFRQLEASNELRNNKLIFANKTKADIIHEKEFTSMLGKNFIPILSDEKDEHYAHGHITAEFLKSNIENVNQHFYVCGPPEMVKEVVSQLVSLGVNNAFITLEKK